MMRRPEEPESAVKPPDLTPGELIERLADQVVSLQEALLRSVRGFVEQQGIAPRRVPLLLYVDRHPGSTVSEIARGMRESKGNVSTLLDRLAGEGWIVKQADPIDRRLIRVDLSDSSRARAQALRLAYHRHLAELFAHLPPGRAEAALAMLSELERMVTAAHPSTDERRNAATTNA
jgi:DNA-binding MarR family transcriptional regulator